MILMSILGIFFQIGIIRSQNLERNINYSNEAGFFEASLELPHIKKDIDTSLINKSINKEFTGVVLKYEDYFKKYKIESSSLVISVSYILDSVYYFKDNVILLYNVYQENIPPYSKSHSMRTMVFDKYSGVAKTLNLCEFIECKNGEKIPFSALVNSKIKYQDCKLIESDDFYLKYFIPIEGNKFIIPVWDELGKNSKSCLKNYESIKLVFEKKELEDILKAINY